MKRLIILTLVCLFPQLLRADTVVTNQPLGYSVYLPAGWIEEQKSDSQVIFRDTTAIFKSRLSLIRHTRDAAVFPTARDWVRAYFIASKLYVEACDDCYPFGVVLYCDSSFAHPDSAWAEIYIRYFAGDTAMAWDEFVRFEACGESGYELYALGDTIDMPTSIGLYGAILRNIDLIEGLSITTRNFRPFDMVESKGSPSVFSLQGRVLPSRRAPRSFPPGAYTQSGVNAERRIYIRQ
jgi:hypothetical protein